MNKNYSSKELIGIKIAHDFEDFIEDQEIVLTLADKPILADQNQLEEDGDILENQEMKEKFLKEFYNNQKNKKPQNGDEDKYEMEKKILPYYDEKKPEKKGIILDDQGNYDINKMNKLELIKKKLNAVNDKTINLNVEKKIASEYAPPEIFPKPMKRRRKNNKENDIGLIDFLEENAENSSFSDFGNRGNKKNDLRDHAMIEEREKRLKMENYNVALEKAQDQTNFNLQKESAFSRFMEEEDEQLEKSLQKQQKIIQQKNNIEDTVKTLLETNSQIEEKINQNNQNDFSMIFEVSKTKDEKIKKEEISSIITSTEFLKNVKTEQEILENQQKIIAPTKLSIKDSKQGITSVVNVPLPSERLILYNKTTGFQTVSKPLQQISKKDQPCGSESNPNETENYDEEFLEKNQEDLKKEIGFLGEEPYGVGLSGVLKKLRERGELGPSSEDYSGRTNDKLPHEELAKFTPAPSDKIKLEYRNQNGKLMTQKEAFRYMCWTFHGKKPGKRKIEKKMKKEQMQNNQKIKNVGETPLMKAFNKVQSKSNLPYMVLSQTKNE